MRSKLKSVIARLLTPLAPGYGRCLRCGMPWLFTKEHTTYYSFPAGSFAAMESVTLPKLAGYRSIPLGTRGCFALCESCWQDLGNPDARRPYYIHLLNLWKLSGRHLETDTREAIMLAVEAGR